MSCKYSIVIVGYQAEDQLVKCLDSLERNPPPQRERTFKCDGEIILIDNSPTQLLGNEHNRLLTRLLQTYIRVVIEWRPENLGFAAACNRGVELSIGENIVLVNPDTEVFPEWAERMSAHLLPDVGGVGPISNFVAGLQNASNHMQVNSDNEKNAKYAARGNNKRGVDTKLLIGFFCMVPRKVWDKVGGMDPQFFLGCDDLDLSMRIKEAGYALVIASDVFVYHEGHASFNAAGEISVNLNKKSEKLLLEKLKNKFGDNIPSSTQLWGCEILPTYIPKRQSLSVCMIVRDDDENLERLLADLWFADEVVIVDTKPDRSNLMTHVYILEWCQKINPNLNYVTDLFPWTDSFADARNHSLSKCTGDWVMWLDADDRVTHENGLMIRAAMDNPGPMTQAKACHFGLVLRDHGPDGINFANGQPRLFPRVEGLKWEGRVHESYIPAALELGITKVDCNIVIDHTGYQDPALMLKKHARNLRLIKMEKESPKKFYHMGKNLQALGKYKESETCYAVVLADCWGEPLDKTFKDQVRTCMASLIITVKGAADPEIDQYLNDNDKPDALFLRAEVAFKRGEIFAAEAMYQEYAAINVIIDSHGSQQEYLQSIARQRLNLIEETRQKVYG